jgi:hypothetical protein
MFTFFLESAFIGALIWGEKRLGPRNHFLAAASVCSQAKKTRSSPKTCVDLKRESLSG